MEAPPTNMYTSKFGSYNANQMIPAGNTGLERPNTRLDTKKNMRPLLPAEYADSKIEEFNSKGTSTANSMEEYKHRNTFNELVQPLMDANNNKQQLHDSSPPCSAPTKLHRMPSPACSTPPTHRMPSSACYRPTTLLRMPSPACYAPTTLHEIPSQAISVPPRRMPSADYSAPITLHETPKLHRLPSPADFTPTTQHEMPSPACSVPTFHGMPSPAYDVPTTLPEMPNPYSTSAYDYPSDYDFMNDADPQYFASYGENAIDHYAGSTTTTLEQTGSLMNSYGPIYIPGMVAPSLNYNHTFGHQGEMYCPREIVDPVNAQDLIQKSVLQTSRPPYDQHPSTLSGQQVKGQQSYRVCGSSSQKAAECKPKCKYCCSFPVEFFRMRMVESFRNQHPKFCKKLDKLSKHLKRMCKKPRCGCSKYRRYHKHFTDLSRDAVKSLQIPHHQEIACNPSLNRKTGAPRTSLGRLGRPVCQISHSSITHQQEQVPETDPQKAIKLQPNKQQRAKRARLSDDAMVI